MPFAFERRGFRSPLLDNLISYWTLDESSAGVGAVTRNDSHSSNHLTDTNTVASATGIISSGASFVAANSERLSIASNGSLQTGDIDFTIAFWGNWSVLPTANIGVIGKSAGVGSTGNIEWYIRGSTGSKIRFGVSDGTTLTLLSTTPTFSTGTWYFVVAWHDAINNTINIQIDDGTVDSQSYSGGVQTTSSALWMGGTGVASQYTDAILDEAGFWKRVLTSAERTQLYNSGLGKTYPAF
jgi:hypothetical protein